MQSIETVYWIVCRVHQNNQHSHIVLWIISESQQKKKKTRKKYCRMIRNGIGAQYSDKINYFMIFEWKWAPDCNRFLLNSLHLNCAVFVVCDRMVINHLLLLYNFTKLFYAIKWNGPLFYILYTIINIYIHSMLEEENQQKKLWKIL